MNEGEQKVNDFQIRVATINGTGSQTSNTAIIRTMFRMGIPVNGKNIFPSNIKGLPTWFEIRVNKHGYLARKEESEILVAMNEATIHQDVQKLPAGGICIYDSGLTYHPGREDIIYYPVPVEELVKEAGIAPKFREYVRNMVYVGALAFLVDMQLDAIESALMLHFGGKEKPVKLNMDMIQQTYDYAAENFKEPCPYKVEEIDETSCCMLMDGNSAGALGSVFGGMQFMAWYPITPSSSFADAATGYLRQLRLDPETGQATYAVLQAEDELAAIGMVLGAGWAGARSVTATSGPGMSLMSEFAGMAYYAEIPSVIWNVQRVGPSTGMPTRTSQGDVLAAYLLGHGDTKHIVLLPANLQDAFEFGWRAFDLAERLQTLIFVLSDLDLGMNLWMSEPFEYPDEPMDRGKVLDDEALLEYIEEFGTWGRYKDVDGDGIPYRTIPGIKNPRGAYFARGTSHNEMALYSESSEDWLLNMARMTRKFETALDLLPQPIVDDAADTDIGIIAYGTTDIAVYEARDILREKGIETNYLRIRALPLNHVTREFIEKHDRVYVFENNMDGQMSRIIRMDMPEVAMKIIPAQYMDGLPLTAARLVSILEEKEG